MLQASDGIKALLLTTATVQCKYGYTVKQYLENFRDARWRMWNLTIPIMTLSGANRLRTARMGWHLTVLCNFTDISKLSALFDVVFDWI